MALITGEVKKIFKGLLRCLRKDMPSLLKCLPGRETKGVRHEGKANKKTSDAYNKMLMKQTEDDLLENFNPVKWLFHVTMLPVLVALMVAAKIVPDQYWKKAHPLTILNVALEGWAGLLLLVVSGRPLVQFATLVLSESLVWIRRTSKYTVYFARKMKDSIDVTLWFAFVLWVWYTLFLPKIIQDVNGTKWLKVKNEDKYKVVLQKVVPQITTLLTAITIGAALWTVKRTFYLKLHSDLHFTALCDRLFQTILDFTAIHYIEMNRRGDRSTENNSNNVVDDDLNIDINDGADNVGPSRESKPPEEEKWEFPDWETLSKIKKETVPIWILKKLVDKYLKIYYRKMETTTTTGKSEALPILYRLEDTDDHKKLMDEVMEMLYDVMGGKKEDNVDINVKMLEIFGLKKDQIELFLWLAPRKDGKQVTSITQDQFVRWALKAVMKCKELRRIIESSKRLFSKLELLMSAGVVVLTIVIWLILTDIVNTGQIALLFTPFISMIFTSSNSLKKAFDGIMFVFALHPFDVGDRIIIDRIEMKVIEVDILISKFIRCDTGKETSYPNSELCTKSIINLEVDPEEFDSIDFSIAVDTPQELVCDLQIKIKKTLDDNITFTSDTTVTKKQISNKKMIMTVYFKYFVTFISSETKAHHRSKVLCKVVKLRKEMEDQMRLQREEIKVAKRRSSSISLPEETDVDFLSFDINANLKLSRIQVLQQKITSAIKGYSRFKGCSKPLFTRMDRETITMDVQVRYPKHDNNKHQLLEYMEKLLQNEDENNDNNERMEKDIKVKWLSKADWDEDC